MYETATLTVYETCEHAFLKREDAVRSLRISYGKIANVFPNGDLSQCTVVFNDKRRKKLVVPIQTKIIYLRPTHL